MSKSKNQIYKVLNSKVSYVGIDIDTPSVFILLKTYLRILKSFPEDKINVFLSPSKRGYHIKINQKCSLIDDLFIRSLCGDDPFRIKLSLAKICLGGGDLFDQYDLLFDEKNKQSVSVIDMKKLLKPHKKKVKLILSNWFDFKFNLDDAIWVIADKIKIRTEPLIVFCASFYGERMKEKIKRVAEKIILNKPLFSYKIFQDYHLGNEYMLVVYPGDIPEDEIERLLLKFKLKFWKKVTKGGKII